MNTTFTLLQGVLIVEASGYWYTCGGEKGSFGYYPHLKDNNGHPVYPDTQLHGDLRMAADWVKNLGAGSATSRRIDTLFGKQGNETAALLHLGDLRLSEGSRKEWIQNRFDIKPRIEINDETRSVRTGMLANFEAAWLDKLSMEAPLYVGYFADEGEAQEARDLLDEAVNMLSGFGALRSRGYGRGRVTIQWQQSATANLSPTKPGAAAFSYALESLVNLRSKPVAAEQLQLVATHLHLTAEQLRGWFVRTFYQATGRWPDADEMATIGFSEFYPSPSSEEPAFPPANTVLRREDGSSIDDYWNTHGKRDDDNESTLKSKLKPLKAGTFITATGKIHEVKSGVRMRNAIQEDFRTLDKGGLFVQQYLPQGTLFCGQITLADPDSDFGYMAYAILTELMPVINGSILQPTIGLMPSPIISDCLARLVIQPVIFDPSLSISTIEGVSIGTVRRYAPTLRRPRRGRPVILPGSVLSTDVGGTIPWTLFGKNMSTAMMKSDVSPPQKHPYETPLPELNITWKNVTRSQAGILRELCNRDHNPDTIGKYLQDIYEKHTDKNPHSDLSKLYGALFRIYQSEGIALLRIEVSKILDHLKTNVWWSKEKTSGKPSGREA